MNDTAIFAISSAVFIILVMEIAKRLWNKRNSNKPSNVAGFAMRVSFNVQGDKLVGFPIYWNGGMIAKTANEQGIGIEEFLNNNITKDDFEKLSCNAVEIGLPRKMVVMKEIAEKGKNIMFITSHCLMVVWPFRNEDVINQYWVGTCVISDNENKILEMVEKDHQKNKETIIIDCR